MCRKEERRSRFENRQNYHLETFFPDENLGCSGGWVLFSPPEHPTTRGAARVRVLDIQFVLHAVDFGQPLVSRQNRHVHVFGHHQFGFWLHRKVLELDFTHVGSHVKNILAVSLLVVSKTQPFSVFFHTVNIFRGPFSSQLPIDWVFGWCMNTEYWLRFSSSEP
jgi:hypothetical protein